MNSSAGLRRLLTMLVVVVLGLSGAVAAAGPASAAATTGSISGRVTLDSGAPAEWLKGGRVSASGPSSTGIGVAVDSVTGKYSVTGLTPGKYRVQFQTTSYYDGTAWVWPNLIGEYFDDSEGFTEAVDLDVAAGTDRGGVDAALSIGQTIRGKLTVPPGAEVVDNSWQGNISAAGDQGGYSSNTVAEFDPSSNTINYEVMGLRPGLTYSLYFSPNPSSSLIAGNVAGGTIVDADAREYYAPGAIVDAVLVVGGRITSTVTLPVGGVNDWGTGTIEYTRVGGTRASSGGATPVTPYDPVSRTMTFLSTTMSPGSYLVRWNPKSYSAGAANVSKNEQLWWPNATVRGDGAPMTVIAGETATADFSPRRASTVTGQAQLSAGQAYADAGSYTQVTVLSEGEPYSSVNVERTEPTGNSSLAIPFEVEVPAGAAYSVRVELSQSPADPLVPWRGWEKVIEGTTVASGATRSLGSLSLAPVTTISGVFTTANLPDDSYGEAVLYKRAGSAWVKDPLTDGGIGSFGDGEGTTSRYYFTNLPEGTYTVGFAARSSSGGSTPAATPQFWDHKSTLAQATPIVVTPNSRVENINGEVLIPATAPPASGGLGTGAVSIKGPGSELLPGVTVEIRQNSCAGPAVWRTTTSNRPDAYGAFGIGLESGTYCVRTLSVPAPYLLPADVVFTMEKRAANWVTVWVPKAVVKTVVTGAVVAKDALGVPINGVTAHISEGSCTSAGRGVWENTTAANRWAQGGFGISLDEGVHCITPLAVPPGYIVPAPFEVTVTSPSPYWVTVWVPAGA